MLSDGQITWLLLCCGIVTTSVTWLAIQQTIKWFTEDKKTKQDTYVS